MGEWADVGLWLGELRRSRRVFHSEADFQHALALAIAASDPGARVRLESRPLPGMRLDLLVSGPGLSGYLAVELKYLTAAWTGEDGGEQWAARGPWPDPALPEARPAAPFGCPWAPFPGSSNVAVLTRP